MKLGVNIDHVATVRQVRGARYPDPLEAAKLCAEAGAHGLTVHLREDRRHIQDHDVRTLKAARVLPLNLEMGNAPEIVRIALEIRPEEACLVPERRAELTTEGGLDAAGQAKALKPTIDALAREGVVVSLFIEPDPVQVRAAADLGAPCIELHTGSFCEAADDQARRELDRLVEAAKLAHGIGLTVNAGHGINLMNVEDILDIPHLDTLNIGHSIVARALMVGMRTAVGEMLAAMAAYRGGRA
jgi:pyridoxine 5-phosphate synthase